MKFNCLNEISAEMKENKFNWKLFFCSFYVVVFFFIRFSISFNYMHEGCELSALKKTEENNRISCTQALAFAILVLNKKRTRNKTLCIGVVRHLNKVQFQTSVSIYAINNFLSLFFSGMPFFLPFSSVCVECSELSSQMNKTKIIHNSKWLVEGWAFRLFL